MELVDRLGEQNIYLFKCTNHNLELHTDFETETELKRLWRIDWADLKSELCNMMTSWSDRWFSVGICKYKLGYKSHDLL